MNSHGIRVRGTASAFSAANLSGLQRRDRALVAIRQRARFDNEHAISGASNIGEPVQCSLTLSIRRTYLPASRVIGLLQTYFDS